MKDQAHMPRHAVHGQRSRRASQHENGDTTALAPLVEQYLQEPGAASGASKAAAQRREKPRSNVAVFGFENYRRRYKPDLIAKRSEVPLVIDMYNAPLGFTSDSQSAFFMVYFELMHALKTGGQPKYLKLAGFAQEFYRAGQQVEEGEEDEQCTELFRTHVRSWVEAMRQDRQRLDVQEALKRIMPKPKWWQKKDETALKRFIFKNSKSSDLPMRRRKDLLKTFAYATSYGDLRKKVEKAGEMEWLISIISNAFFRETSKLGLSWFNENMAEMGIDRIDFILNDYAHERRLEDAIEAKPYRTLRKDFKSRFHEAITYSEYRYALKKGIPLNRVQL